jgi:hypothetical protein
MAGELEQTSASAVLEVVLSNGKPGHSNLPTKERNQAQTVFLKTCYPDHTL